MRILVADDNELVRRGVMRVLRSQNLDVCAEAENGKEAVAKAQQFRPDLVILDISMPVVNGLEAARLIRQILPQTKIIVVTHNDSSLLLPAVRESGADGCVDKARINTELPIAIANVHI